MSKTAIIIQARMGSTRFPNKMVLPFFYEMGILEFILRRLTAAHLNTPIILAIPDTEPNDRLVRIAEECEIDVFRGSEDNVLKRFIDAAEKFDVTHAIRLCADNPFIDIAGLQNLILAFDKNDVDYTAYALFDRTPTIKTHYGFWAEAVKTTALKRVASVTKEPLYCEHVTNYIYANSNVFDIHYLFIPAPIEEASWARFTVDTESDFMAMKSIAEKHGIEQQYTPEFLIQLTSQQPAIKSNMIAEIEKNSK